MSKQEKRFFACLCLGLLVAITGIALMTIPGALIVLGITIPVLAYLVASDEEDPADTTTEAKDPAYDSD